jgi:hypothetical protein
VHVGTQRSCMRKLELVGDAIMVARAVVNMCLEWITCTIVLCAQYAHAHSFIELRPHL